jgi:hypothetical protein
MKTSTKGMITPNQTGGSPRLKAHAKPNAAPQAAWRFPERLVSQGTRLLTQQCWYWGCDVRRPEGNLLLEHGFARTRPPAGAEGSTMYTCAPTPGAQVILWSFGVFYGREGAGGLFLNRFRFEPLLTDRAMLPPAIWQMEQLPALGRAADADRTRLAALLGDLLRWVIVYERRVIDTQGLIYREACLAQWSRQRLGLPAAALVPAWEELVGAVAQCAESLEAHSSPSNPVPSGVLRPGRVNS